MSENGPYPPELEALCDALINSDCDSAVKSRLFNILNNWEETKGFKLCESNKDMVKVLIQLYLVNETNVSKQVDLVLTECLEFEPLPEGPPLAIFDVSTIDLLRLKVMVKFRDDLETSMDITILDHWNICVKMLGRHLHSGAGLINGLMTVVEKAFKQKDTAALVEAAFRSWMVLMDNFALAQQILNTPKRVKLLMRPLTVNNAKAESTTLQKFSAWWHLIYLLGSNNHLHLDTVILPFLKFCYGHKSEFTKEEEPQTDPNSPATPLSPVKKHSSMEKPCLDALVQILASRPLNSSLPKSVLTGALTCPAFTSDLALVHADQILHALLEATSLVKPSNRSEGVQLEAVWGGVSRMFCEAAEGDKNTSAGFQSYFDAVRCCVVKHRRTELLRRLLLNIILTATKLPHKVLGSSSYSLSDNKPAHVLLELLLYNDFVNEASDLGDRYLHAFENLASSLLSSPHSSIQALDTVIKKFEICGQNVTTSGLLTLNTMWQVVANMVIKLENLADQGQGAMVTFNTALHLLKFPVQFLSGKGGEQKTLLVWGSLYQTLVEQAEMSVNHTTSFIANEMGERMENILQANNSPGQLAMHARCNKAMVEVVDWSSLTRSLKVNSDPLAGFKRYMSPLGNATNLVNHLKTCTDYLVKASRKDNLTLLATKELLASYQKLFSISQQELIRTVLKLASPSFAKLVTEDFTKSMLQVNQSIIGDVEKSFASYCNLVKVKYNGEYSVEFLSEVEDVFLAVLDSPRRSLKTKANEMWSVTFSGLPKEKLPEKISKVLKKSISPGIRAQVSSGSEVSFPGSSSSSDSLSQHVSAEPAITVGLQKHPEPQKPSEEVKDKPVMKPPPTKQRQARKSLNLRLEDEDSALFVPIKPAPKSKRVLTDHQKDVLTTRSDDIPALYSELSRDDSIIQLPSQFIEDDSQSLLKASLKERKNKRFEVPSSPKSSSRSRRSVGRQGAGVDNKMNKDGDKEGLSDEVGQKLLNKSEPERLEKLSQESDSCQVITLEKIDNEEASESDSTPIDDLLGDDEDDVKETDLKNDLTGKISQNSKLPPVEVKVSKLSPKVVKDRNEASDSQGAEVKKNLFETAANTSVSSTDDDIIESSQEVNGTPTKSKRTRRTIDRNDRWEKVSEVSPVKKSPKKGVDDKRSKFGETPLHVAAKKGDMNKVKELLSQGANPNIADAAGWYPLHDVAVSGKEEAVDIMSLLISHGAIVDVFSGDGITPLHDAIMYGSKEQVAALVRAGADTELADKSGKTVADLAESSDTQGMLQVIMEEKESLGKMKLSEDKDILVEKNDVAEKAVLMEEGGDKNEAVPSQIPIVEDMECENVEGNNCDEMDKVGASSENHEPNSVINEALDTSDIVLEQPEGSKDTLASLHGRGSISPDGNKENVQTNSTSGEDTESDSEKTTANKEETLRMKSPFTALNPKQKKNLSSGGGTSRGAMLLNLSRKVSIDTHVPSSPQNMSPKPENVKRPWMKYAPSPSHASPSASILKRPADDLDSSTEGSPVSAKRIKLDGSLPRRVHFNANPVSDSVEIPRIPDGKHTRKKLQMSGYDQELFISRVGGGSDDVDSQDSCPVFTESTVTASPDAVFPELADSSESISTIVHNLAKGTWAKVLEAELKQQKIITVGQLARMNSSEVRALRGVKPDKEVTVKNVLKGFWNKVKKDEGVVRIRAPVEEETTPEEEEEIKAVLFARPSPSPTDMGDIDNAMREEEEAVEKNEDEKNEEDEVKEENKVEQTEEEGRTVVGETQSFTLGDNSAEEKAHVKSPIKSQKSSGKGEKSEGWNLEMEETPAKKQSEPSVSDMEVNVGSESSEAGNECTEDSVPSLPNIEAQSTNTPVQSVSPVESVKKEPAFDLTNMTEVVNADLDLATLTTTDLARMYRNLEQFRDKVNKVMGKVHQTMFDKMDQS